MSPWGGGRQRRARARGRLRFGLSGLLRTPRGRAPPRRAAPAAAGGAGGGGGGGGGAPAPPPPGGGGGGGRARPPPPPRREEAREQLRQRLGGRAGVGLPPQGDELDGAVDRLREHLRRVGIEVPSVPAGCLGDERGDQRDLRASHLGDLGAPSRLGREQRGPALAARVHEAQEREDAGVELPREIGRPGGRGGDLGGELLLDARHHVAEELLLRAREIVDDGLRDPDPPRQLVHRRALVAALDEEIVGLGEQLPAAELPRHPSVCVDRELRGQGLLVHASFV